MPKNPLSGFLETVRPCMKIAWSAAAQGRLSAALHGAFTVNEEDRNFAQDLVARAECVAFAYDRLCELGVEHLAIHEEMTKNQPHPNAINLSLVSESVKDRSARCRHEIDVVTSFACYEIKSVADMLRQWGLDIGKRELLYITKTRDRFLAHPKHGGVMRMAHRSLSVPFDGGPVEAAVAGLSHWTPVSHGHYLSQLNLPESVDHNAQRLANETILLSKKHNHQLTPAESVRLKAFGLREPNLPAAIGELAAVLEKQAAPRIEEIFRAAVKEFGFELFPVTFG